MRKTFVALGALMIGGGVGLSASADPGSTITTTTTVTSNVNYDNTLAASLVANSVNSIDITIQGKVGVAGVVLPEAIGQSLVDSKQILQENTINFLSQTFGSTSPTITEITNRVNLGTSATGAFKSVQGNVGVNLNAGNNNAQDNSVAITVVQHDRQGLKADVVRLQEAVKNISNSSLSKNVQLQNVVTIGPGTFDDASGNIGANLSAGYNIAQANGLAVSVAKGSSVAQIVLASSNVGALQNASENTAHVGNESNTVAVAGVATNFKGNLGLNVAIGANLLQSNSLGVTSK